MWHFWGEETWRQDFDVKPGGNRSLRRPKNR